MPLKPAHFSAINVLLDFTATDFTFCFHAIWSNTVPLLLNYYILLYNILYKILYNILIEHHCIGSHCVASVKVSSMNGKRSTFEGRVFSNAFCLYKENPASKHTLVNIGNSFPITFNATIRFYRLPEIACVLNI